MLTNKALSPSAPRRSTMPSPNAKTADRRRQGHRGLGIAMQIGETGDAYHWYPLYTADGGYAFGRRRRHRTTPMTWASARRGASRPVCACRQLPTTGILKASVSYDIASETFAKGKSPYFITGPWQIPEQTDALGDDLMVCPIPTGGGLHRAKPFLGVRTFFQTAKAKNATPRLDVPQRHGDDHRVHGRHVLRRPAPAGLAGVLDKASSDPVIQAFGKYGQQGEPMPSIPQMANVVGDAGLSEFKIASGEDPKATLTKAAESINKANAAIIG